MTKIEKIGREWLDTLVVAISVAMAFRAYFYEPFNIPTGSMQPTLWGYHTEAGKEKGVWDAFPLSIAKWLWTGERVVEYKAEASGMVRMRNRGDGFADIAVGPSGKTFKLPTDACQSLAGKFYQRGETVWKGAVITGDFIFVNRWHWNFWKPKDGEVVIFSTTGVGKDRSGHFVDKSGERYLLQQGTHYIKRIKACPGETYVLEHPVEGGPASVQMGEDEYFACGDNFNASYDSRYWGNVPGDKIRGIGSVVFWPLSGWRKIR